MVIVLQLMRRGTADVLLGLEVNEAVRNLSFLRRGGVAFVNSKDGLRPEVAEHLSVDRVRAQNRQALLHAGHAGGRG